MWSMIKNEFKYQLKNPLLYLMMLISTIFAVMEIYPYYKYFPVKSENDLRQLQRVGASGDFTFDEVKTVETKDVNAEIKKVLEAELVSENDAGKRELIKKVIDSGNNIDFNSSLNELWTKFPKYREVINTALDKLSGKNSFTVSQINEKISIALSKENLSEYFGRRYADRIGSIWLLLILFLTVFTFQRDKDNNVNELIFCKSIKSYKYVLGKFIGQVICIISTLTLLSLPIFIMFQTKSTLNNMDFNIITMYKYLFLWVFPTLIFSSAFVYLLSIVLRSSIAAIPAYLLYFFLNIRTTVRAGNIAYNIDIFHPLIRWDSLFKPMSASLFNIVIINRVILAFLTIMMLYITTIMWDKKRNTFKVGDSKSVRKRSLEVNKL